MKRPAPPAARITLRLTPTDAAELEYFLHREANKSTNANYAGSTYDIRKVCQRVATQLSHEILLDIQKVSQRHASRRPA